MYEYLQKLTTGIKIHLSQKVVDSVSLWYLSVWSFQVLPVFSPGTSRYFLPRCEDIHVWLMVHRCEREWGWLPVSLCGPTVNRTLEGVITASPPRQLGWTSATLRPRVQEKQRWKINGRVFECDHNEIYLFWRFYPKMVHFPSRLSWKGLTHRWPWFIIIVLSSHDLSLTPLW